MKRTNLFPILMSARCAELNALDFLEVDPRGMDWRQAVWTLAGIVGKVADQLAVAESISEATILNHLRWTLLYDTPGVTLTQREGKYQVQMVTRGVGGSYRKLLGSGDTVTAAVDSALGIAKPIPKWDGES